MCPIWLISLNCFLSLIVNSTFRIKHRVRLWRDSTLITYFFYTVHQPQTTRL